MKTNSETLAVSASGVGPAEESTVRLPARVHTVLLLLWIANLSAFFAYFVLSGGPDLLQSFQP